MTSDKTAGTSRKKTRTRKAKADDSQSGLPFGSSPDGDLSPESTTRTRKKAATRSDATTSDATKKPAAKKAAARKTATRKKAASEDEPVEAAAESKRKTRSAKKPVRKGRVAESDDAGNESEDVRSDGPRSEARADSVQEAGPQEAGSKEFGEANGASGRKPRRPRRRGRADDDSPARERHPEDTESAGEGSRDDEDRERSGGAQDTDGAGNPRKRRRRRSRRGRGNRDRDGDKSRDGDDNSGSRDGSRNGHRDGPRDGAREGGGHPKQKRKRRQGREDRKERQGGETSDAEPTIAEGMFFLEKGQVSVLRNREHQWLPSKRDIYVSKKLVQQFKLHDGMILKGPIQRGFKQKIQLQTVTEIDGHPPEYWKKKPFFKNLTSIDPDFHYAVGDVTDDVSMRVVDLIAPIGRGQRGLLVAPPRTGKTTLMRQFAAGIEKGYPDVHLMVLLIDERPEEATDWKRSVERADVFVSTADETAKNHINLAEVVWRRAKRLVEMGEDVVLLLDSITRLARAYNNQSGGSGRTMSGGLDSRAMERPRKFFGSARNTVEAGSLTILGTTLVETGSRLDQLVFEEFKGTGNMELVLNRKLSDRRIFPAIDIEKSGTRKEEKLVGLRRLKLIHVLRRVLSRMHFAEAAELLITRLDDVEKTNDFLERFTVDPEA